MKSTGYETFSNKETAKKAFAQLQADGFNPEWVDVRSGYAIEYTVTLE